MNSSAGILVAPRDSYAGFLHLALEIGPMTCSSSNIPSEALIRLFPGIDEISVDLINIQYPHLSVGRIATPPNDMFVLCAIVKMLRPGRIFEFGTHLGLTTLQLANSTSKDSEIWTIDLPEEAFAARFTYVLDGLETDSPWRTVGAHFIGTPLGKKVHQIRGDSATHDLSAFYHSMDFVFVDGDHSEQGVIKDSETAFNLLRPDGCIVWHDFNTFPEVNDVLSRFSKECPVRHIADTNLAVYRPCQHAEKE